MPRRALSQTPTAIRARERRLDAWVRRAEAEWNAEVRAFMDKGMTFDEAWVAAGGAIYSDSELAAAAEPAKEPDHPYKRKLRPAGCPDHDWCSGNDVCYWQCEADPEEGDA